MSCDFFISFHCIIIILYTDLIVSTTICPSLTAQFCTKIRFALQEREWHSVDDLSPKQGENDGSFELKQFNHNTSKFEVHLQLRHDGQGGLEGDFHIATDLFTLATGTRYVWWEHVHHIMSTLSPMTRYTHTSF